MGWWACGGVRLKEDEGVRMLVDGLVGLRGREVES